MFHLYALCKSALALFVMSMFAYLTLVCYVSPMHWLSCRYVLRRAAVCSTVQTCFSNRLLSRLHGATGTIEALLGVAYSWESRIKTALATRVTGFVPTYEWFMKEFVNRSTMQRILAEGTRFIACDEVFTLHPLILDTLLQYAEQWGACTMLVGEVLQVGARTEAEWIHKGWHEDFAFQMTGWNVPELDGRMVYLRLGTNHRIPSPQAAMLRRVSVAVVGFGMFWSILLVQHMCYPVYHGTLCNVCFTVIGLTVIGTWFSNCGMQLTSHLGCIHGCRLPLVATSSSPGMWPSSRAGWASSLQVCNALWEDILCFGALVSHLM